MIKTIIFDLGGVLFSNGLLEFIEFLQTNYAIPKDKSLQVLEGELGTAYRTGRVSRDEFWYKAVRQLGIDDAIDTLEEKWITAYRIDEDVKKIILSLRKNYKVFYLSDNVKERVIYLERKYNFLELFDGGIFSHDVGVRKPQEKIYKLAIELSGCKPEEIAFIDDKLSALKPAEHLQLKTVHFIDADTLIKQLKAAGLVI